MSADGRPAVEQVVVVVPARDERELLPACLDALHAAALAVPLPVTVVVVLDSCTDGSEAVLVGRPGVAGVRAAVRSAGAARRRGVRRGLQLVAGGPSPAWSTTWLASTDADSRVPASWLARQVRLADAGVDLVLGTVDLDPTRDDPVADAWRRRYSARIHPGGTHPHVHGANLGVRASAYLAAGGFAPSPVHEDVALSRAVRRLPGAVVVTTVDDPVITSARRAARAPDGVSGDLRRLAGRASTAPLRVAGPTPGDYSCDHGATSGAAVPVPATG